MRLASIFKSVTGIMLFTALVATTGCSGNPEHVLVFSPAPLREQTAGVPMVPFTVKIVDVRGEPVTANGVPITISLKSGTDALRGTTTVNTVGGAALFNNVVYQTAEPVIVDFTGPGVRPLLDVAIDVIPNVPAKLGFGVEPLTPVTAGAEWPDFTVEIQDAYGNRINDSQEVVISIFTGSGALIGETAVDAILGVATFRAIVYNIAEDIVIKAESADLVTTFSIPVTVLPDISSDLALAVTQQPQNGTVDSLQTVVVQIQDRFGNLVNTGTDSTRNVNLNLFSTGDSSPVGSCVSGCAAVGAAGGVATFANVQMNRPGNGYILQASVDLPAATFATTTVNSNAYNIAHGAPESLVFDGASVGGVNRTPQAAQTAGQPWTPAAGPSVAVFILDAFGNLTTSNNTTSVTIERQGFPGDPAFVSNTVTAAGGIAQFPAITYNVSGAAPITVQGVSGAITPTPLANVTVSHGTPFSLVFTTQPVTVNADTQQLVGVTVRDALGNTATTSAAPITLSFFGGAPCGASLVSGGAPVVPTLGVSTFPVQIDKVCTGVQLSASNGVLTSAPSSSFNITHGAATQIAYLTAPANATADDRQTVQVEIRDQFANRVTTGTDSTVLVNLAIGVNAGTPVPGSLVGYAPQPASAGVANFAGVSGLQVNRIGNGYTIISSAALLSGAASAVSAPITISHGAAAAMTFSPAVVPGAAQPAGGTTDTWQQPVLAIIDAYSNVVTTGAAATASVTLALENNPTGAFCHNCVAVPAAAGIVTFSSGTNEAFRVSMPGTGYTVRATTAQPGIASAASSAFNITVGAPHHLKYGTAPKAQQQAGLEWDLFTVRIVDEFGNPVTGATATGTVALDLVNSPSGNGGNCPPPDAAGGICGNGQQVQVVSPIDNGTATFTDIFYNTAEILTMRAICTAGNCNGLQLSSDLTASAASAPATTDIDVRPDIMDRLAITVYPPSVGAGDVWDVGGGVSVEVEVQDAFGNVIPTSRAVTIEQYNPATGDPVLGGSTTVNAVLGVATFSGISYTKAGTLLLTATSGALAPAVPVSIAVSAAAANHVAFIQQPVNAPVSTVQTVKAAVRDAYNNIVTSDFSTNITLAIGNNAGAPVPGTCQSPLPPNPPGTGCTVVTAVAGVSEFTFQIDRTGVGYTMQATSAFPAAFTTAFTLTHGAPSQVRFQNAAASATHPEPNQIAGQVWLGNGGGNVTAVVLDQFDNLTTTNNQTVVTVTGSNPTPAHGGFIGNVITVAGGVAVFPSLTYTTQETITVTATAPGLISSAGHVVAIDNATASQLVFSTPMPVTSTVDDFSTVIVQVLDQYGNTVDDPVQPTVSIGFGANPAGGSFIPGVPAPASVVGGFATFSNIQIDRAGGGYRFQVIQGPLNTLSDTFTKTHGAEDHLFLTQPPVSIAAGASQTVIVQSRDQFDNLVTTGPYSAAQIELVLSLNPSGQPDACDSGCTPGGGGSAFVSMVGGQAIFNPVILKYVSIGYQMTATSGLAPFRSVTSASFNVGAGGLNSIVFTTQPGNVRTDETQTVEIQLRDQFNNPITGTIENITLSIGINPAGGTCVGGCGTAATNPATGIATFNNVQINRPGVGYQLRATPATVGIQSVNSDPFTISVGLPNKLVFGTPPAANQTAGVTWDPFTVRITDVFENTIDDGSADRDITVVEASTPVGGAILVDDPADLTMTSVLGVATFSPDTSDRIYALVAGNYTINVTSNPPLAIISGHPIRVRADIPERLSYSQTPPGTVEAGVQWAPCVEVEVQDTHGNLIETARNITVGLATGATDTLFGTTTVAAVGGVATFCDLYYETAETVQLVATSGNLVPTTQAGVTVTGSDPDSLAITGQTLGGTVDSLQSLTVAIADIYGNPTIKGFLGTEEIELSIEPGSPAGACDPTACPFNTIIPLGNVTISTRLTLPGNGYALRATATGGVIGALGSVLSSSFNLTHGAAHHIRFATTPASGLVSDPLAVSVQIEDQFDNVVTTGAGSTQVVTLAFFANPGAGSFVNPAGTPVTPAQAAVAGVATYSNLHINRAGVGYSLTASAGALPLLGGVTPDFDLAAGAANRLAVVTQPISPRQAHLDQTVEIALQDLFGNTLTGDNGSNIQLDILTGPVGAACTPAVCPLTEPTVSGIATFTTQFTKTGTYTLRATRGVLPNPAVDTSSFTITPGDPDSLAFVTGPVNKTADETQTVVVHILDVHGNIATTQASITQVTLSFDNDNGHGPAVLTGAGTVAPVAGVATWPNVRVIRADTGYTLDATTNGPALNAISGAFDIAHGAPSKLAFQVQPAAGPTNIDANGLMVEVAVLDSSDNVATGAATSVTLSIGVNPGSGTLQAPGSLPVATAAGVATWTPGVNGVVINRPAAGYRLFATAPSLTGVLSDPFELRHGDADRLLVSIEPSSATVDDQQVIEVRVLDLFDNLVTGNGGAGSTTEITIGLYRFVPPLTDVTGAACFIGCGTYDGLTGSGVTTVNGVLLLTDTADQLQVSVPGNNYRVRATAAGLTMDESGSFNISAGAPDQVTITDPVSLAPTTDQSQTVTVTVRDQFSNPVLAAGTPISLAIDSGPVGGQFVQAAPSTALLGALLNSTTSGAGTASFSVRLSTTSGADYVLRGTNTNTGDFADTSSITVGPGAASSLAFTVQPSSAIAGDDVAPEVSVRDALGNIRTNDNATSVTLAIGNNPGGSVLTTGTNPATVTSGVAGNAEFGAVSLDKTGTGYTLTASSAGLTGATSGGFNIAPAALDGIRFVQEPSNAQAGLAITPAVTVELIDLYSNRITTDNATTITVTIDNNPGGSTLSGITTRTVVAGLATFTGISLDKTGTGYILFAEDGSSAYTNTSAAFDVEAGPAASLAFLKSPFVLTSQNATMQFVAVEVRDAHQNLVTNASGTVTLAETGGAGTLSSASNPSLTKSIAGGYAIWDDLRYDDADTFTLTATTSLGGVTPVAETVESLATVPAELPANRISKQGVLPDEPNNGDSRNPALSGNGRFVVFSSTSDDLQSDVPTSMSFSQIYFVDRDVDNDGIFDESDDGMVPQLVSISVDSDEPDSDSYNPRISADGRYVVFQSDATDLDLGCDDGNYTHIYVRDLLLAETTCITAIDASAEANGDSYAPYISGSGRFIVYESYADDLDPSVTDINGASDIFLYDMVLGTTSLVSRRSNGQVSDEGDNCYGASVSDNGNIVAWVSDKDDLVSGDTNNQTDAFVRNRSAGTTTRVSVSRTGLQLDSYTSQVRISGNGLRLVFGYEKQTVSVVPSPATTAGRSHYYARTVAAATSLVLVGQRAGVEGDSDSDMYSRAFDLSHDGTVVVFTSSATNLADPTQTVSTGWNVFVRNITANTTVAVSTNSDNGNEPNEDAANFASCWSAAISDDGLYAAFECYNENPLFNTDPGFTDDDEINSDIYVNRTGVGGTVP